METDELLRQGNQMLEQTKTEGGASYAGSTFDVSPVIKTEEMSATKYKMPEKPVSSAANEIINNVESERSIVTNQQALADQKELALNKSTKQVTGLMGKLGLRGEKQLTLEDDANIDEKTTAINDINTRIDARTLAYRREIEALQKDGGITQEQKAPLIQDIGRRSAAELADLSLIQSARNNDLLTAQSIVDRKIKLEFEPIEQQLEFAKFFYEQNKDMFNKADQRAFELKIQSDEREYTEKITAAKTLQDTKLQAIMEAQKNGAPNSVLMAIQAATSPELALSAAGQYVGLLDRQMQTLQMQTERLQQANIGDQIRSRRAGDALAANKVAQEIAALGGDSKALTIADKIINIDSLLVHKGLKGAVGPNRFSRISITGAISGQKQDFIAGVEQLVSQQTLSSLLELKKAGGTLGALSDGERLALQSAATKIGTWRIEKDGKVSGYNASQASFTKELETLRTLSERALTESLGLSASDIKTADSILNQ